MFAHSWSNGVRWSQDRTQLVALEYSVNSAIGKRVASHKCIAFFLDANLVLQYMQTSTRAMEVGGRMGCDR